MLDPTFTERYQAALKRLYDAQEELKAAQRDERALVNELRRHIREENDVQEAAR